MTFGSITVCRFKTLQTLEREPRDHKQSSLSSCVRAKAGIRRVSITFVAGWRQTGTVRLSWRPSQLQWPRRLLLTWRLHTLHLCVPPHRSCCFLWPSSMLTLCGSSYSGWRSRYCTASIRMSACPGSAGIFDHAGIALPLVLSMLTMEGYVQESPANPCPRLLPSMQEIKPPQAKSGQTAARDVRAVAGKLLGQVSAIEPAWHARATLQQPSCI